MANYIHVTFQKFILQGDDMLHAPWMIEMGGQRKGGGREGEVSVGVHEGREGGGGAS